MAAPSTNATAPRRSGSREGGPAQKRDVRFLDPAVIGRLGSMELKARTVVEGFLSGLHRSPYKGFSVEFAEYREYLPGDDLSTLDWKVYARSDRHYVKKFEEETNLDCHILLDVSASMAYQGGSAMTKLEYGSVLAASLAYLMNRQRDATGLIAFDDRIVSRLPARARPGHLHAILIMLDRLDGAPHRAPARSLVGAPSPAPLPGARAARAGTGRSDVSRPLHQLAEALVKRSLVVLISDLLDDPASVVGGLKHLRFHGTDVIVFQLLDPYELQFPFKAAARFIDVEDAQTITADPPRIRGEYLRALETMRSTYERELRGAGIDFLTLDTSKPLDFALLAYLDARSRRK